jgi:uncharacterized membrane protein
MKASEFLTKEQKLQIAEAIKLAEHATSGEIRVHLELHCKGNVLDRASFIFAKLGMHKTALRNGVLFYLAVEDRKFAILGDVGINKVIPAGFWDQIKSAMQEKFEAGKYANGLVKGIIMAGDVLKTHFPYQVDDVNELPDDISYDD